MQTYSATLRSVMTMTIQQVSFRLSILSCVYAKASKIPHPREKYLASQSRCSCFLDKHHHSGSCSLILHRITPARLVLYCITPIFRVDLIFANFDFARNFPPAKIISTANMEWNFAKISSREFFLHANIKY